MSTPVREPPSPQEPPGLWVTVSRPVGGILFPLFRGFGGHPSERSTWEWYPERNTGRAVRSPCSTLLRVGFTEPARSPWPLVRSYRTVSPLPVRRPRATPSAVCSLWHCPAGRPDWPLASTLPCGVPTFLDPGPTKGSPPPVRAAATRPAHRRHHGPTSCHLPVRIAPDHRVRAGSGSVGPERTTVPGRPSGGVTPAS
jgi:hypothetical protein